MHVARGIQLEALECYARKIHRDIHGLRPTDEFLFRANQLRSIIRPATLHQRITIYNTYLLPIMLYLAQLYIVPYDEIAVPLRDHCRKAIVPFNGTAFSYALLVSPHRSMPGPYTPLRDLWATNMALLGSRSDFSASHNMHNPELGDMHHVTTEQWGSLIPHEHEAYAAYAFLRHCPRARRACLFALGRAKACLTSPQTISLHGRHWL